LEYWKKDMLEGSTGVNHIPPVGIYVYTHMHAYIHVLVCIAYICERTGVHAAHRMHSVFTVHVHVCIYVCMCVPVHARSCACMHARSCACT
jgi:hypothetical protein